MKYNEKLVSVIIPNYNKEKYISATLDSLLKQVWSNFECIVVDDNSLDNSVNLIESKISGDSRFFLIKNKFNGGGSFCRNIGIKHAKGDYIMFLDSDDILDDSCFKNRISYLERFPDLNFAVFSMGFFRNENFLSGKDSVPNSGDCLRRFLSHQIPWQTMQPMYRKEYLYRTGGFDENFKRLQDVEFHTRILLKDPQFHTVSGEPDCYFRLDEDRNAERKFDQLEKWVEGGTAYIAKFRGIDSNYDKYLDVTGLMVFSSISFEFLRNEITIEEYEALSNNLFQAVIHKRSLLLLKIYKKITKRFPLHIFGLRRVLKLLMLI